MMLSLLSQTSHWRFLLPLLALADSVHRMWIKKNNTVGLIGIDTLLVLFIILVTQIQKVLIYDG